MTKRFLSLGLAIMLFVGMLGCGNSGKTKSVSIPSETAESLCEHSFQVAIIKHPCIVTGEARKTCDSCHATERVPLPATGEHLYEKGICLGCGQNEVPLTAVSSVYDADGDGKNDVYYFSPLLTNRFDDALHVWAGDYDPRLSSSTVSTATAGDGKIRHWYVAYGKEQSIVYRVTVPEAGLYEMAIHFRMKDEKLRGAKYTVNAGTLYEQVFETSHSFSGSNYEKVRDASTLTSYMYGITVNLKEGENIIQIEEAPDVEYTQHYRDFYFVKVGETHFHSFENATVEREATCDREGMRSALCDCGLTQKMPIPTTNEHRYVNGSCEICGRALADSGILYYDFLYEQPGFAGGMVEFCPESTDTYTFYWGDSEGMLAGYSMLLSDSFLGETTAQVTIQSFTAIPKGATKLLAVGEKGTTYSYSIPQKRLLDAEELYSFGAISDTHQGTRYGNTDFTYNRFVNACKILSDKGVSLIGICGDIVSDNTVEEYILHADALKEIYNYNPKLPVYSVSGNHEAKTIGFSKEWFLEYSRDVVDYDTEMLPIYSDGNELDFVIELPDGSVMIYLNQIYYDYGKKTSRLLDDEQLDWLGARLEQYKERTVFLFFHTYLDEEAGYASTYTGAECTLSLIAGTVDHTRLTEYLTQYQNVIFFSGHSHLSFDLQFMKPKEGCPSNLYVNIDNNDGTFATMVHIPAASVVSSGEKLSKDKSRSEGYIVRVYEDHVVFEGYDFINDKAFAYATYIVQK